MSGINVWPLLNQIEQHPELWGKYDTWTAGKDTVLSQMGMAKNYIELRYNKGHPNQWNREPYYILTEAKPLIINLMAAIPGEYLGRVIISRMAPGEIIQPHRHFVQNGVPKIYDTFQIPLKVPLGVLFGCTDGTITEEIHMERGKAYWFDNEMMHWVKNESIGFRLSMMLDIRPFS